MRVSAASVTARAELAPPPTACAIAVAEAELGSGCSGGEDIGGLGFVRQREFVDQSRKAQRDVEIGAHRGFPRRRDGKAERRRGGVDEGVKVDRLRQRFDLSFQG